MHVLLVLLALTFDVSPEMQALIDKHSKMMDAMMAVRDSAVTGDDGLVTSQEYGRLLKGMMLEASGQQAEAHLRSIVEQYVATLPERMDHSKIMEDIGLGPFGELMRSRLQQDLHRSHDDL